MKNFLRLAWNELPRYCFFGACLFVVCAVATVPLTGDLERAAVIGEWIGIVLMWTWAGRMWFTAWRARKQTHEHEFTADQFIDQSNPEINSDVIGIITSALMNGRVASMASGAELVPAPDAVARFVEDVVTGTWDKSPAELRAMLVTAVDLASQTLFVLNGGDEEQTIEHMQKMALALKASNGEA